MTDFETELDKLAASIAREASASGDEAPHLSDRVEALKVLTQFYIAKRKHPGDPPDDAVFDFAKGVQAPASQDQSDATISRIQPRRRPAG